MDIIGSTELIEVNGIKNVPAKIDTGADSSSIWASNIDMEPDGTLVFSLFGSKSPLYNGELIRTAEYAIKKVCSSHGDEQIRYRVKLPLKMGDKSFTTTFTLANRSRNNFPVLIGRHTLEGNFLVDVSKRAVIKDSTPSSKRLNQELKEDPYKFHQKYFEK